MIDEVRPKHAQKAERKPQTAGLGSLSGQPGPSETCLMRRAEVFSALSSRDLGNPGFLTMIETCAREEAE